MIISEIGINFKFFDHSQQIKMLVKRTKNFKFQTSNGQKYPFSIGVQKAVSFFKSICVLPVIFFGLSPWFSRISYNRYFIKSTSIKSIITNLFCKWMRSINYMRNFIILQPLRHLYNSAKSTYSIVKTNRLYYVHSSCIRNYIIFIFFMELSSKKVTLSGSTYNKNVCYHD